MNSVYFSVCVVLYIGSYGECWKIPATNDIFDHDSETYRTDLENNQGPEKIGITLESSDSNIYGELLHEWLLDNDREEDSKEEIEGYEYEEKDPVQANKEEEELIKNSEKLATKDLLNGLKRILNNKETLEEVLAAENDKSI